MMFADGPAAPLSLEGFLPGWDIERRSVDLTALARWVQSSLAPWGSDALPLDRLHERMTAAQAHEAAKALTRASADVTPRALIEQAVAAAVSEVTAQRYWLQTHAHVRILVPGDEGAVFPPHTDHGFGHSLCERNIWLSLTDARGDAALHLMPLAASLSVMTSTGQHRGVLGDSVPTEPFDTAAGEVLLFTPLHVHRARAPSGDATRVSIDVRILPARARADDLGFSPMRLLR